ncbi:sulfotransferase [Pirellulales bacterium]|nr:sulfotransferase [Pirellulales bacterium]
MARKTARTKPVRQRPVLQASRRKGEQRQRPRAGGRSAACLDRARRLADHQQFDEAIKEYRRALKQDPKRVEISLSLASIYLRQGDFSAAAQTYEAACALAPQRADVQRTAGQALQEMGRHRDALAYYQRAVQLEPTSIESHCRAAQALERQHRLEEARTAVDRALSLGPDSPLAMLMAAVLDRREGDLEGAECRLTDLLGRDPPQEIAWRAWYELAHVRDRAARYDAAMSALLAGKKLLRKDKATPTWVQRSWRRRNRFDEALESLTADHLERWHGDRQNGDRHNGERHDGDRQNIERQNIEHGPPAILIGHPRSGTTMAQHILDAHPKVVALDERHVMGTIVHNGAIRNGRDEEPTPDRLDRLQAAERIRLRGEYWREIEKMIDPPLGDRLLLDKHPQWLTYLPSITRVFPDAKVIVAIRDPRDVCLSCYMQQFSLNATSVAFLSLEGTVNHYVQFMKFWLTLRSMLPTDWIEFRYEDMAHDIESESRRLTDFLGLTWDDSVLDFHLQARQKDVSTPSYEAVTQPVNTRAIGRWKNYAEHFEPLLAELEPFVEAFGYTS